MSVVVKPYQHEGIGWLSSKRNALLADDMGLGKTLQTIHAADRVNARRLLVVCPAVARINWLREFERFSSIPRDFQVIDSRTPPSPTKSIICSYDLAHYYGLLFQGRFDALILDEAHFIKSHEAARSRSILGRHGIHHECSRIWALTGTPAPNGRADEVWLLLYVFGQTRLSYGAFVNEFCNWYMHKGEIVVSGTKKSKYAELQKLLAPIMLRRRKDDVLKDLPPLSYEMLHLEPGEFDYILDARTTLLQYADPVDRSDELAEKLENERTLLERGLGALGTGGSAAAMKFLEAMATSVSTLRVYNGLQKMVPTAEIVRAELEAGAYEKIVLFAWHADVIDGLRKRLEDFGAVTIYGQTPAHKRQKHIDSFEKNPRCRVIIVQILAAGTAISLVAAHHGIFVEQSWVPGHNAQAAMRLHRIGQKYPVFMRVAKIDNSLEGKIDMALQRKSEDIAKIFDGGHLQNAMPPATNNSSTPDEDFVGVEAALKKFLAE